jgi:OOP family OmpA-OmpF porin
MSRHSGLRAVLATMIVLSAIGSAIEGFAGIGDAIKKAGDKATKKAEEAADNTKTDKAPQAPSGGEGSSASSGKASGAPATKVSSVSTKFDYVPGDSVIFFDDMKQDELGEFPARWNLVRGTWEVAELEGERWLRCTSTSGTVRMKVPPSLPEFWTLEFDLYYEPDASNALTVSGLDASGYEAWQALYPYSYSQFNFRSGSISSLTTPETPPPGYRHHVMFLARGTALKVYLDQERMVNVPDVTGERKPSELEITLAASTRPMITNVRFAEGPRPPKDMLAEGKLVTYGIFFASGSDVVLPESAPVIRQVASYMEANPAVKLRITGHTDNVGSSESNADLSKRRSASVAWVLAEQFKVASDRFETDGKGDAQPIASNGSPEGKAKNRRVEFAKL